MPVARDQDFMPRATSTLSFIAGLGDDPRHERRRHRPDRQPARRRARGRRLPRGETPAGERWTRSGALPDQRRGHAGRPRRQPGAGRRRPDHASTPTETDITIAADGTVMTRQRHQGQAPHRRVRRSAASSPAKATTSIPAASPLPAVETRAVQGAIERSNVSGVTEMAEMIRVNRAYQTLASIMQRQDDLRRTAIQRLGDLERLRRTTDESPLHRIDRHERAGAQRRSHLQQHRQHAHDRLQAQRAEFQDLLYQSLPPRRLATPRTRARWCRSASRSARASRPRRPRAS